MGRRERWTTGTTASAAIFLGALLLFRYDPNNVSLPAAVATGIVVDVAILWLVFRVVRAARHSRVARVVVWFGVVIVCGFGGALLSSDAETDDHHTFPITSGAVNAAMVVIVLLSTHGRHSSSLRRMMMWAVALGATIALLYVMVSRIDFGYGDD